LKTVEFANERVNVILNRIVAIDEVGIDIEQVESFELRILLDDMKEYSPAADEGFNVGVNLTQFDLFFGEPCIDVVQELFFSAGPL
jgi:hypothetical protein